MLAVLRRRFHRLWSLRHGVNDASASGGGEDCQNNFHGPATLTQELASFARNGAAQSKTPPAVQAAGL